MKTDTALLPKTMVFARPPRILHADDDTSVRGAISRMLERSGYEVVTVKDGLQAWEAVQTEPFDLLITDNEMPYISGVELVFKIRQHGLSLPIIIASSPFELFAKPEDPHWQNIKILPKPFSFQSLDKIVKYCLNPDCLE